ncbi:cell envelope integrity EipB family protein [Xanthobacter sp. DSM 24535]|uniref:cell envelope integrity EipB family protein n=1 Tax=Roseixanthobacter psychrophilus TaxID=3119917 RepID=UPI00372BA1C6
MVVRSRLIATLALTAGLAAAPLGLALADPLLAHRTSYALSLDGSKTSQKLEGADGRIDYEMRGDACEGYAVKLRQTNRLDTGEGAPVNSDMLSTSWEDGTAATYRFKTLSRQQGDVKSDVDATANRTDTGLSVKIAKPRPATVELTGKILLPTEHVLRVVAAAKAGESVLEARVFDGSDDGVKVFDTLAVIGKPSKDEPDLPDAAKAALAGHTFYPTTVSYFEPGGGDETPEYVMSFSLYDNGVIGALKIDYNDFVLRGRMEQFEALPSSRPCDK